ncbi:MAG: hypothetical protein K2N74_01885, partial [Clostridiales bacterium]|nr:hypothetical protein [Clostridiales bacterium]
MKDFLKQKRNLAALCVWGALVLALIGGLILDIVLYNKGSIEKADFNHRLLFVFLCFIMMTLVFVIELAFGIRLPLFLELSCCIFAFVGLAGGTVYGLYGVMPAYDKFLHTTSGLLFSAVGLTLSDILLKNQPVGARRAVAAVAIAFFFSLAVGYLWEIFEFSVDSIIPTMNNQRWQWNDYPIDMGDGTFLVGDKRGTALIDTLGDMIVNLIGTVVFLVPMLVLFLKKPNSLSLFHITVWRKKCNKQQPEESVPEEKADGFDLE